MKIKKDYSDHNPAQSRLIFSGILDMTIALFFSALIAFTIFFLITPMLGIAGDYEQIFDSNYNAAIVKYFGGQSEMLAMLFLVVGMFFLLGFIFSTSYIKLCFNVAKNSLSFAKNKTKKIAISGCVQIVVALLSIGLSVFTIIKLKTSNSTNTVFLLNVVSGIAFLVTGSIKISSSKLIKKTKTTAAKKPVANANKANYLQDYYHFY